MSETSAHAALMNSTYRHQRRIYDLTRKYYLFGRDHLIRELAPPPGGAVLEVACGTGRNLAKIARRYPDARLFGLDISSEMLESAAATLNRQARLAEADATAFDGAALFEEAAFPCIFISYGVSMIPDWRAALDCAAAHLAPGGALHVVDFGDQGAWPGWFGRGLRSWLARFHVTPRPDLGAEMANLVERYGGSVEEVQVFGRYAVYVVFRRAG
ncbi:MAG: class I SAM-dependent methyltransferase [Pseudomonadota bacterium]